MEVVDLVRAYLRLKAEIKIADQTCSSIMDTLIRNYGLKPGDTFNMEGVVYTTCDNFSESNSIWRPARVERLTIKEPKR